MTSSTDTVISDEERADVSAGDRDAGEVACEELLALDSLPDHIRTLTRQNQTYYARQLIECAPSVRADPSGPRRSRGSSRAKIALADLS